MTDLQCARRWLDSGEPAIVIEVAEARGSAPRGRGTRMLVSLDACAGTIGGGHLEWKAIEKARGMLTAANPEPQSAHYPLGPALGQCCGGAVTLSFSMLDPAQVACWPRTAPRFHLQLYGAGHVGRAIARLLATIDCEVDWIDEREDEFPPSLADGGTWPAHIARIAVDAVEAEVAGARPGSFFLVLTHQHDLDLRICEAILARADFGFLGLIGSKTKRQRFFRRFEQRGVPKETVELITCPVGVAGIDGKEPEVIAIAVVAQLLQRSSAGLPWPRAGNQVPSTPSNLTHRSLQWTSATALPPGFPDAQSLLR